MPFSVASIDAALSGWHHCRRWVVGFSGGMDSTVLLTAVHEYLQRHAIDSPPALVALHINHHLHPDADAWQDHCRQFCHDRGIAFESVSVTVPQRGDGPEAAARQARYNAFTDFLRTEDLLLLAQHRDDQAETVLLNLMRGSGSRGLRGIPVCRQVGAATLLRPLLDFSRSELVEWANAAALDWIEDDSNRDTALSRNFLRQRVLPVLREHWPAAETAIASSAGWLHQEQTLLEEVASEDLGRCARRDGEGLALRIDKMLELSAPRRANLLRYWLLQFGVRARRTQLQEIGDAVILAAADGRPLVRIGGHSVRRHGGAVYCVRDYPDPVAFLWTPEAQRRYRDGAGWSHSTGMSVVCALRGIIRCGFGSGANALTPLTGIAVPR